MTKLSPLLLLVLAPPTLAQWETASGGSNERDGFARTDGPLWPEEVWSVDEPVVQAVQPVVADQTVFYARIFDWSTPGASAVEARDLLTGTLLWSVQLPLTQQGVRGVPLAVRDGRLYCMKFERYFTQDKVIAVDPGSGAVQWISEPITTLTPWTSPSFFPDGDLFANGSFKATWTVFGYRSLRIDSDTGKAVWNRKIGEGTIPSLGSGATRADRTYLAHHSQQNGTTHLRRIDQDTGAKLYQAPGLGHVGSSPFPNQITVAPDGSVLWSVGWSGDASDLIAYEDTGTALVERWRLPSADQILSTVAVDRRGDVLYMSDDHELVRVDLATGSVLDRSMPLLLPHDKESDFSRTRLATDRQGLTLMTVCGEETKDGVVPSLLLGFDEELELLWSIDLGPGDVQGVTLSNRFAVVSTPESVIRAFRLGTAPSTRATATARRGSGTNPVCLFTSTAPVLGETWRLQLDASVLAGATFTGVLFTASPASPPVQIGAGEVLVDLGSPKVFEALLSTSGGRELLEVPIPFQLSLAGLSASGQGFAFGGGARRLCNGLDVTLGM